LKKIIFFALIIISSTVNGQLNNSLLLSGGSNGFGFSIQRQINAKLALGASGNSLNASTKLFHYFAGKIIKTKASTNSLQAEAFVKWFPLGQDYFGDYERNRLFIRAGAALRQDPTYNGSTSFWDKFEFGDFVLTPDQIGTVDMKITTNKIQPFVGMGYSIINSYRFNISAEAGSFYHGTPKMNVNASGILQSNAMNEAQLNEIVSTVKFLPYLRIEAGIKF
jgi:hypothetical protein